MKVRAMVCHAPGAALVPEELDLAPPGPGEVLIEIMASGLCHSDLGQIEGTAAPFPFPIVVGHEGAGIVRALGPGVTGLAEGDHVVPLSLAECGACPACLSGRTNLCDRFMASLGQQNARFSLNGRPVHTYVGVGSLAQFIVMPQINVARIRPDTPFDLACLIGCAVATGVGAALHTARVEPGSSVAVFGLGGIGLNVLQGARLAGASTIIGVDRNPARAEIGRTFGMTHFIDPAGQDPVTAIRALTMGGADHTFECVGSTAVMQQALSASRAGWGCCTVLGVPADGAAMAIVPFELQLGRTVRGSFMGNVKGRSELPTLLDHHAAGRLNLADLVSHRLALEQVNQGFAMMKSGAAVRVVIDFAVDSAG